MLSDPGASPASTRVHAPVSRVLTLTVVDQGASSISNFALAVLVAHGSHAEALGVFAVLTVTYVIAQGVVRSVSSDCLLTRSELDDRVMDRFERSGYLAAVIGAVTLSALIAVVGAFLPHDFAVPILVFAACFPFIAMQDFSRFIGISRHQPGYAIWLDSAWVVLFLAGAVPLEVLGRASVDWLWATWTISGGLVGVYTLARHFSTSDRRALLRFWIESERAVGIRFAGNYLLTATWIYFIYYPLLLVISVPSVGLIKLAQLVLGPITVLAAGLQSAVVSIVAKRFQESARRALWFCFFAGTAIAVSTALWTVAIYLLPVHDVARVFGPTWGSARTVYLAIGLAFVFGSYSGIAVAGLRAIRSARANLRLGLVMVPLSFLPQIGGAALWGAKGFAVGMAVSFGLYAVGGWYMLIREARRFHPGHEPTSV
jgi:O-antigen/teichoic acid export membrane protein